MRALVLGVVLAASVGSACGQAFAVFSPDAVKQIAAQKDSHAWVMKFVHDASGELGELKDDPHPMERVHTEGTLAHQGIRDQSQAAERDWDKMLNFAMAYRLSGEPRYLAAADRFLGSVDEQGVYHASFNPIDEDESGQGDGMTFDLTRGQLKPATEARDAGVAARYCRRLCRAWMEQRGDKDIANWSSHRVKLAVLAAYELGDAKLQARAAKVFRDHLAEEHAQGWIGRGLLQARRSALRGLRSGADGDSRVGSAGAWRALVRRRGEVAKTLAHGVDWLLPFATGQKKHIWSSSTPR